MADEDRPQLGDTPAGKTLKKGSPKKSNSTEDGKSYSPMGSVGKLVQDLATGGANAAVSSARQFTGRPDGRTDGGSGHDER